MLLLIVQVVTLLALGIFLLVEKPSIAEVAKWVAGVGSIVWAVLLVVGL